LHRASMVSLHMQGFEDHRKLHFLLEATNEPSNAGYAGLKKEIR
jgi:hypothetical protein